MGGFDYLAAKNIGVDALWIENPVSKIPEEIPNDLRSVKELSEMLIF